jgi:peptide/nickel transport system permease protein
MVKFWLRSLLTLALSAVIGSAIIFLLLRLTGGNIAYLFVGENAAPGAVAAVEKELGLNEPLWRQYFSWLGGVVTGNLGESYGSHYDIGNQIVTRLEPTLLLTFGALIISIPIALILGLYSAMHHLQARGAAVDAGAQLGLAIPQFFLGLVLALLFAVKLGWLPSGGYVSIFDDPLGAIRSLILPIAALSLSHIATLTRFVRSSMLTQLNEGYIRTARAKGLTWRAAALKHGLRNAAIPLITIVALQVGSLIAGAVVIENVFVIPGVGQLLLSAVLGREVVVVQSVALVILLIVLVMNMSMDIVYSFLDPRVRRLGSAKGRHG